MLKLTRRFLRGVDVPYLLLCFACSFLSVLVLASVGEEFLGSHDKASVQLIASLLGAMMALIFSTVNYRALCRAWPIHALISWGLVLPTLFLHNVTVGFVTIGYDAGGTANYSWYRLGGMTFQPAELAKISLILTLAAHLDLVREKINRPLPLLGVLAHIFAPVVIIHIQGDDGTALVFLGIGLTMLFAAGLSYFVIGGALAVAAGAAAVLLKSHPGILKGYQFSRILAVLYPEDASLSDFTYQQNKSAMAIGSGGLTGAGLFGAEQVYVPNAWNDFIFAYLAHALGFLGAALVLILLFCLAVRTLMTGLSSRDGLGRNICVGVFGAIFWQSIINLGMNLQILPVIGVTLPFFSSGGSSVLMMYLCIGLVMSVYGSGRKQRVIAQFAD